MNLVKFIKNIMTASGVMKKSEVRMKNRDTPSDEAIMNEVIWNDVFDAINDVLVFKERV